MLQTSWPAWLSHHHRWTKRQRCVYREHTAWCSHRRHRYPARTLRAVWPWREGRSDGLGHQRSCSSRYSGDQTDAHTCHTHLVGKQCADLNKRPDKFETITFVHKLFYKLSDFTCIVLAHSHLQKTKMCCALGNLSY